MFVLRFSLSMNLSSFAQQVESYKMISPEASQLVAHTLPFVEIVLGLLLLIGWRLRIWATAITAIMVGFLAAVTRAYLLHMDINCGCFGTPEKLTGMTVVRDGAFTALALLMTVFRSWKRARRIPGLLQRKALSFTAPMKTLPEYLELAAVAHGISVPARSSACASPCSGCGNWH